MPQTRVGGMQVLDEFQVLVAAHRALHAHLRGEMKTKNVHSELVYNLGAVQNVPSTIPLACVFCL